MMAENEKLIESVRDWPTITRMSHSTQLEKLGELRDALEAAEKALTPTDDEIGMAAEIHTRYLRGEFDGESQKPGDAMRLAVLEGVRAGFRRSEVPEPSAEEWAARITAAREKAITKGYTPGHDAKHGVRHLLRWAIDYARRGRAEDSSGLVAAAIDLADIAYAELARLRHVADTMRAVSEALRTRYASDSQAAYFMRQIDAALEAVPELQGEPSDAPKVVTLDDVYEVTGLEALVAEARSRGEWCCENGCGSGACETCPCCSAGWCVSGVDGVPEDAEAREVWLEVAAEYNPVAAALRAAGGVR